MSRTRIRPRPRRAAPILGGLAGLIAGLAVMILASGSGRGDSLVADLSDHLIAITTAFTGTEVVLFGAIDDGGDVVVVVRGPQRVQAVRRMERIAGIWVNRESMVFVDVPSFYVVAANRPVEQFARPPVLERLGIGLDHLRLQPAAAGAAPAEVAEFRAALIRSQQREGLYGSGYGQVAFLGQRLFRTNVHFPANVPTGYYTVNVMLFRDGEVVSAQTTPLVVSKIGLGADIFAFAQQQSAAYGLLAIAMAVSAGWLASAVFRRG